MQFNELLSILERETTLPIKPNTLAKIMKEGGMVEQIKFVAVNLDTTILKGKFVRLKYEEISTNSMPRPYEIPENGLVIKVYYARSLPKDEKRLVVNKELLHAIDPDFLRTATIENAVSLVSGLKLPRELLVDKNGSNLAAFIDYMSDYRAVVAMIPQHIRDLTCAKFNSGKINEDEIASLTGVPRKYVSLILDDNIWHKMKNLWCHNALNGGVSH